MPMIFLQCWRCIGLKNIVALLVFGTAETILIGTVVSQRRRNSRSRGGTARPKFRHGRPEFVQKHEMRENWQFLVFLRPVSFWRFSWRSSCQRAPRMCYDPGWLLAFPITVGRPPHNPNSIHGLAAISVIVFITSASIRHCIGYREHIHVHKTCFFVKQIVSQPAKQGNLWFIACHYTDWCHHICNDAVPNKRSNKKENQRSRPIKHKQTISTRPLWAMKKTAPSTSQKRVTQII